jgi:hypothetical protein
VSAEIVRRLFKRTIAGKISFLFTFISLILSIYANLSGVGWSWDTSDYVAVGKNFAQDLTLLDATGLPMTVRPLAWAWRELYCADFKCSLSSDCCALH